LRRPASGRDENLHAVADNCFDLALMPVTGVRQHHVRIIELDRAQLALSGADHRFEMPEVG
jgi:hypothetical protein